MNKALAPPNNTTQGDRSDTCESLFGAFGGALVGSIMVLSGLAIVERGGLQKKWYTIKGWLE